MVTLEAPLARQTHRAQRRRDRARPLRQQGADDQHLRRRPARAREQHSERF
jgi:hypothetical protein